MRIGKTSNINTTRIRERAFVREFIPRMLKKGGHAEAAKLAGYSGSSRELYQIALHILRRPNIKRAINRLLKKADDRMIKDPGTLDVISELALLGGSNIANVSELFEVGAKKGLTKAAMVKDLREKLDALGDKARTIKKIRFTDNGIEFDMHDKIRPLELLGDHNQLFVAKPGEDDKGNPDGSAILYLPSNGFELTIKNAHGKATTKE